MICVAGPAAALSCIRPDVARSYQQAADAEEEYVILLGTFSMDRSALNPPRPRANPNLAKSVSVPAKFSGKFLGRDGFVRDWQGPVKVTAQCFGPWCAGAPPAAQILAFVQKTNEGYHLALSPCGGFAYANPTPKMLNVVKTCHASGPCRAEPSLR